MTSKTAVAVIGGGAWGTALAQTACRADAAVTLWARELEVVDAINRTKENAAYLPDIILDSNLKATSDLTAAAAAADVVLLVVPAQHLRATAVKLATLVASHVPVLVAAKGIEIDTGATMLDVAHDTLRGHPIAILSGPTFATEVARGLPTAVTVAADNVAIANEIVAAIGTPNFRPYVSDDPIGCAIGGAVKNVLAIACGIVWGRSLGDNARAALITRGLAEMTRLAVALGAKPATLMGLSGMGDLVLTCNATQSRNCSLGIAMGQGQHLKEILDHRRSVAEGVTTATAVCQLAAKVQVEMPICEAVQEILHHGASIDNTIKNLLGRPFRSEAAAR